MKREQLLAYAFEKYNTCPDHPFRKFPSYEALRHEDNHKIYGLIMNVKRGKLNLSGDPEEIVDILNVKCSEDMRSFLMGVDGVMPCYHMHSGTWISILIDGSLKNEQIYELLDLSFELTSRRAKVRRTASHNKYWLVPANPKYYDIEKAIQDGNGTFLWKQSSSILKDDIVYMYLASPISAIKYQCKVPESDIPYSYTDQNVHMSKVMRLQLIQTYEETVFPFAVLREYGVTSIRGPRSVPDALLKSLRKPENK